MRIFIPTIYQKNIFEINYTKLKEMGIKCLIFDLDNTLALIDEANCPKKTKELCQKLKKDFKLVIISNNNQERIKPYMDELDIDGVSMALKPSTKGLRSIVKKYGYNKDEMIMIGDQIMTDIVSGNRFKIMTALVEPLGKKDLKITSFNRFLEKQVVKKLEKRNILKRGKFYE